MATDESHHEYLRRVLDLTGLTQTQLAHRAGLDPSTLSRFLTEERSGHTLRASTLRKIELATGILIGGLTAPQQPAGFAEAEAEPIAPGSGSKLQQVVDILSAGGANIDAWTLRSTALEGVGYRVGDTLLVALGEPPVTGDVVCAQIYDWTKGRAETVFRIFQPPYLVAASHDTRYLRPHLVDDGKVMIKGIVVQSLRGRAGAPT